MKNRIFGHVIYFILIHVFSFSVHAEGVKFTKQQIELQFKQTSIQEKKIQKKILTVEIARTEQQLQQGLMNRTALEKDSGMLFIFNDEQERSFWMKNTLIDLSIGYFNADGKLIDIQEMKAVTSILQEKIPTYKSAAPAMYALEMPRGWFKSNGVATGATLKLLDPVKEK